MRGQFFHYQGLVCGHHHGLLHGAKQFEADVLLEDGRSVTAHCPNSGRMTACSEPGMPVYLSRNNHPGRKLKYTWELIEMPGSLVGVNTGIPNALVRRSIEKGYIRALSGYDAVIPEVKTSAHTRLDLMLENTKTGDRCYVEVKNCTLVENGTAFFPDAVTDRGAIEAYLRECAARVFRELTEEEKRARTVTLKLKYHDFRSITRRRTLDDFVRGVDLHS